MRSFLAVLAFALATTGCDQPPLRELASAEAAVRKARDAGADRFVAERYREAEAALQAARTKAAEKDYRGALSSATDATEKARAAALAATAARTLARSAAETALAEAAAPLDEVAELRDAATEAQIPDEAFADVATRVDEVRAGLQQARELLDRDELARAQQAALDLKPVSAALPALTTEARATWEQANPRKKRARRR